MPAGPTYTHDCRTLTTIACVCAGGVSCSISFVGTMFFASGRLPQTGWSPRCSGAARVRRSGFAVHACTWLTVLCACDSGRLTSSKRPILSTSRQIAGLLRTVGSGHGPHTLVVSLAAQAVRPYDERCRVPPVYGSRVRWSRADFDELFRPPESLSGVFFGAFVHMCMHSTAFRRVVVSAA